jgi:hypothetical protein
MCVTSALEPRFFRHSLMSDSSCPISSFPCAKNIFIGICSPFPTGGRPDRPSEWLSAEVAIVGLASLQDATSSISVIVLPTLNHGGPIRDPAGFSAAVIGFLSKHPGL